MAKVRNVKINIDGTPTSSTVSKMNNIFKKGSETLFRPFKTIGNTMKKSLNSQAMAGWGKDMATDLVGLALDAVKAPIDRLKEAINTANDLSLQGAEVGLTTSRMANLKAGMTDIGLGGKKGDMVLSDFKKALEDPNSILNQQRAQGKLGDSNKIDLMFMEFMKKFGNNPKAMSAILGNTSANLITEGVNSVNPNIDKIINQRNIGKSNIAIDKAGSQAFTSMEQGQISADLQRLQSLPKSVANGDVARVAEYTRKQETRGLGEDMTGAIKGLNMAEDGLQAFGKGITTTLNTISQAVEAIANSSLVKGTKGLLDWWKGDSKPTVSPEGTIGTSNAVDQIKKTQRGRF